jgi:ubiquitin C-terminal hydrolase
MPDAHDGNGKKLSQGKRITMLIRSLFQKVHCRGGQSNGMTGLAPRTIVKALPTIGTCGSRNGYKFRPGRQEDANEFLVHLLDAMHDGELRESGMLLIMTKKKQGT